MPIHPWHSVLPLPLRRLRVVTVSAKGEKLAFFAALFAQPFDDQIVFVRQHFFQPFARNIAFARPVNRVGNRHVVGRHRLGDGVGGAAHAKEPAHDFLARADFGESAVFAGVLIEFERLLTGRDHVSFEGFHI